MAQWCRRYAKEVEDYIDTLDVLVKDDVYEELLDTYNPPEPGSRVVHIVVLYC